MKRYILSHVPMALIYGLVVVVLRGGWSFTNLSWIANQGWWILGILIGVLIVFLDRVAYVYSFPAEQLSQQAMYYFKAKKYGAALNLLDSRRHEQIKLTFRSALFMAAWVPLAFFALTSTVSPLGKGVVLGVMLHILVDAWQLQRRSPETLNSRLFWQIGRTVRPEEQLVFLWIFSGIFLFLSLWGR